MATDKYGVTITPGQKIKLQGRVWDVILDPYNNLTVRNKEGHEKWLWKFFACDIEVIKGDA